MHSDNVLPLYIHLNADTCADRVARVLFYDP
jgi:hypothetical protein